MIYHQNVMFVLAKYISPCSKYTINRSGMGHKYNATGHQSNSEQERQGCKKINNKKRLDSYFLTENMNKPVNWSNQCIFCIHKILIETGLADMI